MGLKTSIGSALIPNFYNSRCIFFSIPLICEEPDFISTHYSSPKNSARRAGAYVPGAEQGSLQ
jgi:hypothetical protein